MTINNTTTAAERAAIARADIAARRSARLARAASNRAESVERAALAVLERVAANRAANSERRSSAVIHGQNRAASRATARGENGRDAARERAASSERHALIVEPYGARRIDVPVARSFDGFAPIAHVSGAVAVIVRAAFDVAERIDAYPADVLARLHGVPLSACMVALAHIERRGHTG